MPRQRRSKAGKIPVTELSRIGNLGCIRFPKPLRESSGIKRGDRLIVQVIGSGAIRLEKVELASGEDLPAEAMESLTVEGCACETPPESCQARPSQIVTVGWSYVQLSPDLATGLGFLPDAPVELSAEPSAIAVTLALDEKAVEGIGRVICPP